MNTLDTRDLYTRKCELEKLRDDAEAAADELREALGELGFSKDEIEEAVSERSLPPVADDYVFPEVVQALEEALQSADEEYGEPERDELKALEEVENEIGTSAFLHGETLIPERGFKEYARELAEDIGAIPDNAKWPCTCIDWEQAAEELRQDYSSLEYEGKTYYFRS